MRRSRYLKPFPVLAEESRCKTLEFCIAFSSSSGASAQVAEPPFAMNVRGNHRSTQTRPSAPGPSKPDPAAPAPAASDPICRERLTKPDRQGLTL